MIFDDARSALSLTTSRRVRTSNCESPGPAISLAHRGQVIARVRREPFRDEKSRGRELVIVAAGV
ncbi:MAG: hypothetical protein ACYC19_00870 [Acidimicrobiales bacterium]